MFVYDDKPSAEIPEDLQREYREMSKRHRAEVDDWWLRVKAFLAQRLDQQGK